MILCYGAKLNYFFEFLRNFFYYFCKKFLYKERNLQKSFFIKKDFCKKVSLQRKIYVTLQSDKLKKIQKWKHYF